MKCDKCKSNFIDQTYKFSNIIVINHFAQSKAIKQLRRRVLLSVRKHTKKALINEEEKENNHY